MTLSRQSRRSWAAWFEAEHWLGWLAGLLALVAIGWNVGAELAEPSRAEAELYLQSLSEAEKEDLLRNYERLEKLPTQQRDDLRAVAAEIERDPHAAELQQVMRRYHKWLAELSTVERAELLRLPVEQRVARIEGLRADEASRLARRLPPSDGPAVLGWFYPLVIERLPEEQRQQWLDLSETDRQRRMAGLVWQLWLTKDRSHRPPMLPDDVQRLARRLSPEGQQRLANLPTHDEQAQLIIDWIRQAMQRRVSDVEVRNFFQQSLSDAERERLLAMPREAMLEEVETLMRGRNFTRAPGGRDFFRGPGPGRRFGPGERPLIDGPPPGPGSVGPGEGPPRPNPNGTRGEPPREPPPRRRPPPGDVPPGDTR